MVKAFESHDKYEHKYGSALHKQNDNLSVSRAGLHTANMNNDVWSQDLGVFWSQDLELVELI